MEIIRTKIVPPADARGVVPRPRLTGLAREISHARLTIVQAPAGYGKTTLLCEWRKAAIESGAEVGWLTIDVRDRTPDGLFVYLAATLVASDPALGADLA